MRRAFGGRFSTLRLVLKTPLDPAAVAAYAAAAGLPLLDADAAARLAGGAQTAIDAVRSQLGETLIEREPGEYLATLERLADEP